MNKYRVLMEDSVNGEKFNFAMHYEDKGLLGASLQASDEFTGAKVVKITEIKPTLDELLQMATKQTKGVYIAEATL